MGRDVGLDSTIRNQIIASLAFLTRKRPAGIVWEFNHDVDYGECGRFYTENIARNKDVIDPNKIFSLRLCVLVIPRTILEKFVKTFFGMNKKTFIKHTKQLIDDGIIEETRLKLKGKRFGYILKPADVESCFIRPKKDEELVEAEKKQEEMYFFIRNSDYKSKIAEHIKQIFRKLGIDTNEELTWLVLYKKYPKILHAILTYDWNAFSKSVKYDYYTIPEVKDESARFAKNVGKMATIFKYNELIALKEFVKDLEEKNVCPHCVISEGIVQILRNEPQRDSKTKNINYNTAEFSCGKCGYTVTKIETSPEVKMPKLTHQNKEGKIIEKKPRENAGGQLTTKEQFLEAWWKKFKEDNEISEEETNLFMNKWYSKRNEQKIGNE